MAKFSSEFYREFTVDAVIQLQIVVLVCFKGKGRDLCFVGKTPVQVGAFKSSRLGYKSGDLKRQNRPIMRFF